jgi:hypothetical protein
MTPADMVSNYIKLRDFKKNADDEYKKSMEKVNLAMEKLEGELLRHLNETGGEALKSPAGTVYKSMQTSASVKDPAAFKKWLLETDEWEAIDLKANKTYVKEYAEEHGAVPPGVNFTQVQTVGVRRS